MQHRIDPCWQLFAIRNTQRDPGLPDLVLGADQALAHGGRRDQKGRGNHHRVQTQQHLQNERRPHARLDRRMGAREHQSQAVVWNLGRVRGRIQYEPLQLLARALAGLPAADAVNQLAPRHCQQPAFRIVGAPAAGPVGQGGRKCLCQSVLGRSDIVSARREKGDELAITAARDGVRSQPCSLVTPLPAHGPPQLLTSSRPGEPR